MYLKYLVNFLRKLHRKKTTNKNTKKKVRAATEIDGSTVANWDYL